MSLKKNLLTPLALIIASSFTQANATVQVNQLNNVCDSQTCVTQFKQFKRSRSTNMAKLDILANMYLHGYGTDRDVAKASKLLRKVAKDTTSNYHRVKFALLNLSDGASEKQLNVALRTLERAAKNDDAPAAYILAAVYSSDDYNSLDKSKADFYQKQAIDSQRFTDAEISKLQSDSSQQIVNEITAQYTYTSSSADQYLATQNENIAITAAISQRITDYKLGVKAAYTKPLTITSEYYMTTGSGPIPVSQYVSNRPNKLSR